jgi:serine/threonine-protein kinase
MWIPAPASPGAHDRIIHRDLKPQNIMMNKRGDVIIMDFGLAAIADQLSGAEVRNGAPAYMAPDQLRGAEVTAKSDIYALGLVLYELFTGKRPFDARGHQDGNRFRLPAGQAPYDGNQGPQPD